MSFEKDKSIMLGLMRRGISHSHDEAELESFLGFIDKLEKNALTESDYYSLAADCYIQAGDMKKAREAFIKIYNPKNKKDVKKLYDLEHIKSQPRIRPSRRETNFPPFRYVDKEILTHLFVLPEETACTICGGRSSK